MVFQQHKNAAREGDQVNRNLSIKISNIVKQLL